MAERKQVSREQVKRAVHMALIDSVLAIAMDKIIEREGVEAWFHQADAIKAEWMHDIHAIPSDCLKGMDAMALCQNVGVRLLGLVTPAAEEIA